LGGGARFTTSRYDTTQISPLLIENIFLTNQSARNGGGCHIGGADAVLIGNTFRGNSAAFDGGALRVSMVSGSLTLLDNVFIGNTAEDHGGGVELVIEKTSRTHPGRIEGNLFVGNLASGKDTQFEVGTGGAISARPFEGTIRNNTFVGNTGTGKADCTGGGLLVNHDARLVIEQNIFVGSRGCGLSCRNPLYQIVFRDNLLWSNSPFDASDWSGSCLADDWESMNVFADPLFCDPAHDDYRVRSDSPALTNGRQIGAFLTPGCDPP